MADGWIELPSFDAASVSTADAQDAAMGYVPGDFPERPRRPPPRDRLDERSWAVAHPHTFASQWNRGLKTYWNRHDEALRMSPQDALAMRRDGVITACMQRRVNPVASLPRVVDVDNPKDPRQQVVKQFVQKLVDATPRFQSMCVALEEAIFFGRAGSQLMWGRKRVNGYQAVAVIDHIPVHGDKILWKWSGVPGILINAAAAQSDLRESVKRHVEFHTSASGPALFLKTPALRRRFIIHEHNPTDQDYLYESDLAGAIRGVGIRGRLWHVWNIRNEILSWALDALQRIGANGGLVGFYPEGNPTFRDSVEEALANILREHIVAFPYQRGEPTEHLIKQLPVNPTGYDVLKVFADYFDAIIREIILGEAGPGSPVNTRLAAELVEDGRFSLQRADANNLAETLTADLVQPLIEFNRPLLEGLISGPIDFGVKLKLQLDKPNSIEDLQSAQLLIGVCQALGVNPNIDVEALVEKSGLLPSEDDPTQVQPAVSPMQGGEEEGQPGAPPGGQPVPNPNAQNPQGPNGYESNPRIRTPRPTENRGGDPDRYDSDADRERYARFEIRPPGSPPPANAVTARPMTYKTRPAPTPPIQPPKPAVAPPRALSNLDSAPPVTPTPAPAPSATPAPAPTPFRLSSAPVAAPNPKSVQGSPFVGGSELDRKSEFHQKPSLPGQIGMFDREEPKDVPSPEPEPATEPEPTPEPEPSQEEMPSAEVSGVPKQFPSAFYTPEEPLEVSIASKRGKGPEQPYAVYAANPSGSQIEFKNLYKGGKSLVDVHGRDGLPECNCSDFLLGKLGVYRDRQTEEIKRAKGTDPNPTYECKHIKAALQYGLVPPTTKDQYREAHEFHGRLWDEAEREAGA